MPKAEVTWHNCHLFLQQDTSNNGNLWTGQVLMADKASAFQNCHVFAGPDYIICPCATNTREDNSQEQQPQQRWQCKVRIDANLLGYKYVHDQSSFEPDVAIKCIAQAFFVHQMMGVGAALWHACHACRD